MDEEDKNDLEKIDSSEKDDSEGTFISNKKTIESYKKQIKAISPKYNQAIEQATKSIKMVDISNKIALAKPQILSANEQIVDFVNSDMYKTKMQTIMPTYQNMLVQAKNAMGFDRISTVMGAITKQQLALYDSNIIQQMTNSMSNVISQIAEVQKQFMNTISETIARNVSPALKALAFSLEEAKNNPDSLLSWMNYYNRMSEFFWIMPYKITTEELHEILQNVSTEKEFDQYINKYFNKAKVELLIKDIIIMLPNNNQRKIFDQIVTAYKSKSYALASIGITTMIDNCLSYYLIDKGCTSRLKLFEPIIKDLDLKRENSDFSFIVMMVNSNINLLYEQIEFNNKISINTNKKSRRNPISHGKSYSYKKIDTIMLLNTMYYLLVIQNELKGYKNSLYRNSKKKEFYIPSKDEKRRIIEKIKSKNESSKNNQVS